jgi:putative N6-adenine-specific DNA methylase
MTKADALEKRIKRNVTAREHRFFAVVSPGLGDVCMDELKTLLGPERNLDSVDGGIEFTGTVNDAYRANLHLRTASRIIMRFSDFTATDFQTLEKKLKNIPWELYIRKNTAPRIHATAKKSRLHHTGAIDQRFRENIAWRLERYDALGNDGSAPVHEQNIYVRVVHDRFELSLDSSGELLYMRGLKTQGGRAPLRETLAAGLLILSGYDGAMPLVDPMCGAGTFSLEASMISRNIPPGFFRTFAFERWPCFREGAFRHIRKTAEEGIRRENLPMIYASDADGDVCASFSETVRKCGFSDTVSVKKADALSLSPPCRDKGLVMINPPYGLRIGGENESREFVAGLFKAYVKKFSGWRIGIVSPFDKAAVKAPRNIRSHILVHGGLKVFLLNCTIP